MTIPTHWQHWVHNAKVVKCSPTWGEFVLDLCFQFFRYICMYLRSVFFSGYSPTTYTWFPGCSSKRDIMQHNFLFFNDIKQTFLRQFTTFKLTIPQNQYNILFVLPRQFSVRSWWSSTINTDCNWLCTQIVLLYWQELLQKLWLDPIFSLFGMKRTVIGETKLRLAGIKNTHIQQNHTDQPCVWVIIDNNTLEWRN